MTGLEAPALLVRGRFAVTAMPDGSWIITRAGPLCGTCQDCGCGDQEDPIVIPAMLAGLIKAHSEGKRPSPAVRRLMGMAGRMLGGGTGDEGTDG